MGSAHCFVAWSIVLLFIVSMELKAGAGPVRATTAPATEVLAPESHYLFTKGVLYAKNSQPVKY
jgi:hypothetical protein